MGIKGLFSYIENYVESALQWHKLHDCKIIIDGSNLAYDLFNNCPGKNVAFGGDYDKFASSVEDFFKKLILCNVEPYVVMDGGYPIKRSKFRTVYERMMKNIDTCRRVNPDNQSHMCIFPLMGLSVFVNVIQKLGITVLQCDFEADDEIVVLAKKLNAYVLSNDSDFYLFDVPFILLNSVNIKYVNKELKKSRTKKYIPCYLFNAATFTKVTKVSHSLLPVLAPVLGNDFFSSKMMLEFYDHVSHLRPQSNKISDRHKIIISVIKWLATQPPEPDTVLEKIIKLLPNKLCYRNTKAIKEAMSGYFPTSSTLEPWIEDHRPDCPLAGMKKSYNDYATSKINFDAKCFIPQSVKRELKCTCQYRVKTDMMYGAQLPGWFIRAFRLQLIPSVIVNLLNKNYFFTIPQIEFQERKSVYLRLECIVIGVRGLLWSTVEHGLRIKENLEKPAVTNFRSMLLEKEGMTKAKEVSQDDDDADTDVSDNESSKSCDIDDGESTSDGEDSDSSYESQNSELKKDMCSAVEIKEAQCGTKTNDSDEDVAIGSDKEEDSNVMNTEESQESDNETHTDESEESEEECEYAVQKKRPDREEINIEAFRRNRKIPMSTWFVRNFNNLWGRKLCPEKIDKYRDMPTLYDMETLSAESKKELFFKICQFRIEFDQEMPQNIEFILIVIGYWYMKFKNHVPYSTFLSVLMCVLMFCIIDGQSGRRRSTKFFENASSDSKKVQALLKESGLPDSSTMTLAELIKCLTKEEYTLASLSLFQFHKQDPEDSIKNYDRCSVHAYSEFQACFYFLNLLNSLLCFPFPSISIESYWSGTFCYNIRKCFTAKEDISVILTSIFGNNLRFIHLFIKLYSIMQKQLSLPFYDENSLDMNMITKKRILAQKKKKLGIKSAVQMGISTKRKRKRGKESATQMGASAQKRVHHDIVEEKPVQEHDTLDEPTDEELAALVGNRFSTLLLQS